MLSRKVFAYIEYTRDPAFRQISIEYVVRKFGTGVDSHIKPPSREREIRWKGGEAFYETACVAGITGIPAGKTHYPCASTRPKVIMASAAATPSTMATAFTRQALWRCWIISASMTS